MEVPRTHPEPARSGETAVRVLVAFEDARGVYGEAIARALAELRPDLEVRRGWAPRVPRGVLLAAPGQRGGKIAHSRDAGPPLDRLGWGMGILGPPGPGGERT